LAEGVKRSGFFDRWISSSWMKDIIEYSDEGRGKQIKLDDLPDMHDDSDKYDEYLERLTRNVNDYIAKGEKRPLMWGFFKSFWHIQFMFFITDALGHCNELMKMWAYGLILDIITNDRGEEVFTPYIIGCVVLNFVLHYWRFVYWHCRGGIGTMYAHRVRFAVKHLLYRKMLSMQAGSCESDVTEGTIIGIMDECGELWMAVFGWPGAWGYFTLNNVMIGGYLFHKFGAVYGGMCILVAISIYGVSKLSNLLKPLRDERDEITKANSTMLSEVFNEIKMIKLYGWQQLFYRKMTEGREKDMAILIKQKKYESYIGQINSLLRNIFPTVTLTFFFLRGNSFDLTFAIMVIDYFNRIFGSYHFIPHFINWLGDRSKWEERCSKFLRTPDMQKGVQKITNMGETSVDVNGSFSWGFVQKEDVEVKDCVTLHNMNFKVKKGEFVCVVGAVGCGKSSLLNAISSNLIYMPESSMKDKTGKLTQEQLSAYAKELSKLEITDAPVKVCGSVAFAEQKAWIENKTIKDTILFGKKLDEERYQMCVKACQLTEDFEKLKAGDKTELGENGINLSGG